MEALQQGAECTAIGCRLVKGKKPVNDIIGAVDKRGIGNGLTLPCALSFTNRYVWLCLTSMVSGFSKPMLVNYRAAPF
jgi:hypothetical protein